MIVKMRKYAFLVYHGEYELFLNKLHEHGVVHVVNSGQDLSDAEELLAHREQHKRVMKAIKELRKIETEDSPFDIGPQQAVDRYYELIKEREHLHSEIEHLKKEHAHTEPWGEFDPQLLEKLKARGREVLLYTCARRCCKPEWEKDFPLFIVNRVGTTVYMALVTNGDGDTIDADPVRMPTHSLKQLEKMQQEAQHQLDEVEGQLNRLAAHVDQLEAYQLELMERYTFEKVFKETEQLAESKVSVLYGWVPETKADELEKFLQQDSILYQVSDPTRKDDVPVLLKNSRLSRLFESIGQLYSLPNYGEMDLTAFFAPFYWLFFGFCLGDAGYGILLALSGFLLRNRLGEKMRNTMTLVGLLGLSTILFGIIGGTFFGMNLYEMKFALWGDVARHFDPANNGDKFNINDHLFNLALILGAVQIIFGMFIKVMNESRMYGFKNALGSLGWFVLVVGGILVYALSQLGLPSLVVDIATWTVVAAGGAGAFLFNNPERNIFANIGAGLWDAYNMVSGLLGDLLSYIRLFALGISSAILGYVFNSLAMALSPDVPVLKWIVMVIILLIGHGINMFMSSLGSFVHPMRLTFVEFYKNSGFIGGGKKYQPFARTTKK
ncbi:V-type ATP synthase subunit I [Mangrovibacterium marinum]|uniref:V/A-type H+-transporting ATPase subunit I n=1 Tax=Mangrovibacterium marinum TaxID=1639118 RepID=A0A2T5C0W4_9BACT|nr:V-type ATPase 116kDa subunit family protein [Mangrovibacterium marinum]PTN08209.1 V/A-type H+-transporting ATPase subunit I [Mangrovibacterium marinum]